MRYAIAVLTNDNDLYACHEVADSQTEAILNALKSLKLYDGQPVDSLQSYLSEIDVEVDVISIKNETDGCVTAVYYAGYNSPSVEYYENYTTYEAVVHTLGDIAPHRQIKNLDELVEFIEYLGMLVDCKEVEYHDCKEVVDSQEVKCYD